MKRILFFISILFFQINCLSQQVVGYLPYYRGTLENFDYSLYTHIHYFTIWPGANGEFIYPGGKDSVFMANQFTTIAKNARAANAKMIVTFGGPADHGSLHFVEMAANDSIRNIFVNNVLQLCTDWNADGIDVDWEWAQHTDTETSNYAFTKLMEDLRIMCDENDLSLSLDVSASSWGGKYYNPEAVNLADYVNIMSYTYSGAWSSGAGHHSSMKDIEKTGIPYWVNRGIPKSKLNIGTAFFGQLFEGTSQPGGVFTKVRSVLYPTIKQLISEGYVLVENNMNGSYCYSSTNNEIVFLDSPQNTAFKMDYAIKNGFSGLIIWEIGQDDNTQSLATAIDNVRKGTTQIGENKLNTFPYSVKQINGRIKLNGLRGNSRLEVFNLSGAKIYQSKVSNNDSIETISFPSGIYILNLFQDDKVYSKKITVL